MTPPAMTPEEVAKLPYRPCVGLMITNQDGQLFVGRRLDERREGEAWQMPQGGIDEGETPKEAAFRELGEETGIEEKSVSILAESADWHSYDIPFELTTSFWSGRYRGQEQKWFLLRFHGQDSQINIQTEIPEFSEWRWINPDEVVDNIVPFKREVYTAVLAEFKPHI